MTMFQLALIALFIGLIIIIVIVIAVCRSKADAIDGFEGIFSTDREDVVVVDVAGDFSAPNDFIGKQ